MLLMNFNPYCNINLYVTEIISRACCRFIVSSSWVTAWSFQVKLQLRTSENISESKLFNHHQTMVPVAHYF